MSDTLIRREVEMDAPVDQVWPYLATEAGLRQWWGNEISLEPKPGGRCAERTIIGGREVTQEGVVTVYDPPRQLTLTFTPNGEAWPALARISITLEADGERTRLAVVHHLLSGDTAEIPRLPAVSTAAHGPQMRLPRGEAARSPLPPALTWPQAGTTTVLGLQQYWDMRLRALQVLVANLD